MENNKKISAFLNRKKFEECLNVFKNKLRLIFKNENYKIVNSLDDVEKIQEAIYKIIKKNQQAGKSYKYNDVLESIKSLKNNLITFPNDELYIILMNEEQYVVIEMALEYIIKYCGVLFQLSEGDLVVSTKDYSIGLCIEYNHYHTQDEYEITIWSIDI